MGIAIERAEDSVTHAWSREWNGCLRLVEEVRRVHDVHSAAVHAQACADSNQTLMSSNDTVDQFRVGGLDDFAATDDACVGKRFPCVGECSLRLMMNGERCRV